MRKLLCTALLFFFSTIQAEEPMDLKTTAERYVALLNRIGSDQTIAHQKEANDLCTPHCKKIVNGAVWYETRDRFVPQLLETGEKVGFWSIEPLDIISGSDGKNVVIRFLVPTEKAGTWNTLVILRCNADGKITEINEIFNAYES
jgi:hypothetical protein